MIAHENIMEPPLKRRPLIPLALAIVLSLGGRFGVGRAAPAE
jgi:hypothetical protein